ncbi:polymorphic toxin-type HINT domain-containing protein [Micromonospora arborensis]|uniref:polymorphic toxin-type HINT domain-containing protein n=1 Tax=Micromonospora arborensis TaxID=2116518 RepID=UPI0037232CAB
MTAVMSVVLGLGSAVPAHAEDLPVPPPDRDAVVQAWRMGGPLVREAAEAALVGSDADVEAFLSAGWVQKSKIDERLSVNRMVAGGGVAVQTAGQAALGSSDPAAISTFLESGWQAPTNVDQRIRVNQMMAAGGGQLKAAAQKALDADAVESINYEAHKALSVFIDSGWRAPYLTDLRIRVNQISSAAKTNGNTTVQTAAERALDVGTMEALSEFVESGWAIAASRDQEIATLKDLVSAAQDAQKRTEQQTQVAKDESAKAVAAAAAAKKAAAEATAAMDSAQGNAREAAAAARQAANAAESASKAARQAVAASQAAIAAARVAANAATRAASAAALTRKEATKAQRAAARAATDASKASEATAAAKQARDAGTQARTAADAAGKAGDILLQLLVATGPVGDAIKQANAAADAAEAAARRAAETGVNTQQAINAAQRARANADRATRAAAAASGFANEAAAAAHRSRDAANRAAADADAAAAAADEAALHAGEAATAAKRSTDAANAATTAANEAVAAAEQARTVYDAARKAEADRLSIAFDEAEAAALLASSQSTAYAQQAAWDAREADKRTEETNRLIAVVLDPATERQTAVTSARKVAVALTVSKGAWTQQAAMEALGGTDEAVLDFVRTGIAAAAGQDDRATVLAIAADGSAAMNAAAEVALAGSDADVAAFLANQQYPERATEDRLAVNQILAQARDAGRTVTQQKAQQALDAGTATAFRDFLRTGQYAADAADDRVEGNRILVAAATGTELKAAAQVALDGPPSALREFLKSGQYKAAQNDYDTAAHDAEVSALLSQAASAATKAVQQAEEAQAVAATARGAAADAQAWANKAAASAQKAATYADQAISSANAAQASADKAAASAKAALAAANAANSAATRAAHSAAWAQDSYAQARKYAGAAAKAAREARDSALAAEKDYATAQQYYRETYAAYIEKAKGEQIAARFTQQMKCEAENFKWSDDYRDCMHNVTDSSSVILGKAMLNGEICQKMSKPGEAYYRNCMAETFNSNFGTLRGLDMGLAVLTQFNAILTSLAVTEIFVVTAVFCNAVCGTLLGLFEGAPALMGVGGMFDLWATSVMVDFAAGAMAGTRSFQTLRSLNGLRLPAAFERVTVESQAKESSLARLWSGLQTCLRSPNSFIPGTPVLLADGTSRAIEDVRVGDRVLATDPYTGDSKPEAVTATITGTGEKHLVDITLDTDGAAGGATATLTATDEHPFWDQASQAWVDARDLGVGSWLRTDAGRPVEVLTTRQRTEAARVHNLTVAEYHTYYALAADVPVLTHNTGCWEVDPDVLDDIFDSYSPKIIQGVEWNISRYNEGATDHALNGIGTDAKALAAYLARPRTFTHYDKDSKHLIFYDDTKKIILIQTAKDIHGYNLSQESWNRLVNVRYLKRDVQ